MRGLLWWRQLLQGFDETAFLPKISEAWNLIWNPRKALHAVAQSTVLDGIEQREHRLGVRPETP
jgi:hypothetical protein